MVCFAWLYLHMSGPGLRETWLAAANSASSPVSVRTLSTSAKPRRTSDTSCPIKKAMSAEEVLSITAVKGQSLSAREAVRAISRLGWLNHRYRWYDAHGNLHGGLNRTAVLYHLPYTTQRAALCRRCTALVPELTVRQTARCLFFISRLQV